ncbi:MAG: ABC transporter permease, partial [Planctomycetes bacterium]|nr:ABC transporter permease [Planctomycetota bacterium]
FLWWAIFDAVGQGARDQGTVAGYSYQNVVAYYLLVMVGRAFSSMPGLASGIASQIRNGEIKKYLIQPVDLLGFLLLTRMAHKLAYYSVAVLPFAFVFYLCRGYFVGGWPEADVLAGYVAALVMAFLLGFFLEAMLGLLGFWFLEISSLLFIYMLLGYFLSGHMFPLDMLPPPWRELVGLLPMEYLAYFPSAVFLGKVSGAELVAGLWTQAGWVVAFVLLSRIAYHRGVRRYSGFGG